MRLKLVFQNPSSPAITLPIHYNEILQAFFYRSLPGELAEFLHEIGFFYNNRKFKLFTFSKIFSRKLKHTEKNIVFSSPITVYLSSVINYLGTKWGENLIMNEDIKLGENKLQLQSIQVLKPPVISEKVIIKTLSPIAVYRTVEENGKKTQYYFPENLEFQKLIKENVRKKYHLITGKKLDNFIFEIKPAGKTRIVPLKYKNFFIKASEGTFQIHTRPEILKTIYDAGLGAKNSQGFGMIQILKGAK